MSETLDRQTGKTENRIFKFTVFIDGFLGMSSWFHMQIFL